MKAKQEKYIQLLAVASAVVMRCVPLTAVPFAACEGMQMHVLVGS